MSDPDREVQTEPESTRHRNHDDHALQLSAPTDEDLQTGCIMEPQPSFPQDYCKYVSLHPVPGDTCVPWACSAPGAPLRRLPTPASSHSSQQSIDDQVDRTFDGGEYRLGTGGLNKSKYRGVSYDKKKRKWRVQIKVASLGKSGVSVGYYDTEQAAARAYDRAAIGLLGRDNANIVTNFPLTEYEADEVPDLKGKSRDQVKTALKSERAKLQTPRRRYANKQRTSRFNGVSSTQRRNQWQARILVDGKVTHLGYYESEEEAAHIYDQVSISIHGSSAQTNFSIESYKEEEFLDFKGLDREALQRALGVRPMEKPHRSSGITRITKRKWEAKVMVDGQSAYRKVFGTKEAAAGAYEEAIAGVNKTDNERDGTCEDPCFSDNSEDSKPDDNKSPLVNVSPGCQRTHPMDTVTPPRAIAIPPTWLASDDLKTFDLPPTPPPKRMRAYPEIRHSEGFTFEPPPTYLPDFGFKLLHDANLQCTEVKTEAIGDFQSTLDPCPSSDCSSAPHAAVGMHLQSVKRENGAMVGLSMPSCWQQPFADYVSSSPEKSFSRDSSYVSMGARCYGAQDTCHLLHPNPGKLPEPSLDAAKWGVAGTADNEPVLVDMPPPCINSWGLGNLPAAVNSAMAAVGAMPAAQEMLEPKCKLSWNIDDDGVLGDILAPYGVSGQLPQLW